MLRTDDDSYDDYNNASMLTTTVPGVLGTSMSQCLGLMMTDDSLSLGFAISKIGRVPDASPPCVPPPPINII